MPPNPRLLLQKAKHLSTQTPLPQIILFLLAKICTALMELPHEKKQSTYIPFLVGTIILLSLAITLKILRHKFLILRSLPKIQLQSFLLWVITMIMMVFTWSLLDALEWGVMEIIMTVISIALSIFMLTLMTNEQFITKMEFLAYQVILGVEIVAVSIKTVGFIKFNSQSPHKDIVLLNLTTQIALMIILMDFLEKSYKRMKALQVKDNMARLQNQMVFVSKPEDTTRNSASLKEALQFRQ